MGQLMGNDLVPDHELALSVHINKNAVLQTELDTKQAIQYLRRGKYHPEYYQKRLEFNDV